jgi:hypothetical protein
MIGSLLAVALAASASAPKLAVLQIQAGEGVPPTTAAAVGDAVVAEVRKQSGAEVITQREISSILSLENQKAMLGCSTDSCMAELGGALGADRLVAGDMARLGESFLLHLRVVDVKKVRVAVQADRRLRGGTIDDVLDVLPAMVAELFGKPPPPVVARPAPQPPAGAVILPVPATPGATPVPPPAGYAGPATPPVPSGAAPAPWMLDEPDAPNPATRDRLMVMADDEGMFFAIVPYQDIDAPFWVGDGKKMYRQRVIGGGSSGRFQFDRTFWDPRARAGAESSLSIRGGRATLYCGKKVVELRVLGEGGTKKILGQAEFFAAPFRRIPHLLARDDQGNYFLVDAAREADTGRLADPPEYRLRYGRKGALAPVEVVDATGDPAGLVVITPTGRLVQKGREVEWLSGAGKTTLTVLDVRDSARLIYQELGAYGKTLGTACDGRL